MTADLFPTALSPEQRLTLALLLALLIHAGLLTTLSPSQPAEPADSPVLSLNLSLWQQPGGTPGTGPTTVPLAASTRVPDAAAKPAAVPSPADAPEQPPVAVPALRASLPRREPDARPEPVLRRAPDAPREAAGAQPSPPAAALADHDQRSLTPLNGADRWQRDLEVVPLDSGELEPDDTAHEPLPDSMALSTLEGVYLEGWRRKVERVGTLNFPRDVRQLGLSSGPTLAVTIRADGSLQSITLLASSGHSALDTAARRIVQQAAPFAPFPPELRRYTPVLSIVRKWKFEQGRVSSR
jgi:protein TonB